MTMTKTLFRGRILALAAERHRLPDGREAQLEVIRHPGGAAVLPLEADGRVVLIRQYRPIFADWLWEIPAGRLEAGEAPDACARRELAEEAGLHAGQIERLGRMFSTPGFCDEVVHLFVARGLTPVPRAPEADEFIETTSVPLAEALAMLARGEIADGKTQLALLLLRTRLEASRES